MEGWRFFAERLNGDGTATLLHSDLNLSGVQISYALSGPGGFSCSVSPESPFLLGSDGRPIFREWSTAIWAEQDGILRGGGIVDHIGIDNESMSIECVGFAGYPNNMPYTGSQFFIEADPADIARHIWAHLQGQVGGNLGVTLDQYKTGLKIGTVLKQVEFDTQEGPVAFESGPYKLEWWQTHDLLSNFDGLSTYQNAFEYRELVEWDGDDVRKHIRMERKIGSRKHDLRFAIGENIQVVPSVEFSGEEYANGIIVLGAGEGRTMVQGRQTRMNHGRLRRVAVVQDKSIRSIALAVQAARRELGLRQGEFALTDLVVRDHPHAPIGSWDVGDEILLEGDLGWVDNLEGVWVRVVGLTISPESSDVVTASVIRTDKVDS